MQLDKKTYKSGLIEFLMKYAFNTQLVIPVYQRNYTWTVKGQIEPFLNDIESVLNGDYKNHFMGIIIYNITKFSPTQGFEFSIIDGQQRLTTTIILLYAVRDFLAENNNEEMATKIENAYLSNNQLNGDMKLKLKPLVSDDLALRKIINKELNTFNESDINSNVYKNYLKMKEWLLDMSNSYTIDDILEAIDNLYVVAVPIDNDDYPQKIFESINSKGVPLTDSDLIRNYIFMGLDNTTQEKFYDKYWKKIEELISSDSKQLEAFLRIYVMSKNYYMPTQKNNGVYKAFKILLEEKYGIEINKVENIEDILENITLYANLYNFIYLKDINEINVEYKNSLIEFRRLSSVMPAPLLLRLFELNNPFNSINPKIISDKNIGAILDIVTNYLMRRAISNLDTSDVTRMFTPVTRDVINEADIIGYNNIVEICKKHIINKNIGKGAYCPDNNQLKTLVETNSNMYNLKATRMFLDRLEMYNNPAKVDLSGLSVEHLMPQTATEEWLNYLNCSLDDYYNYLNKIGNLTLATKPDNSKMGNKPYEYKIEILKDTNHLNLNTYILNNYEGWSFDNIDNRTQYLIKKLNEIYPYQSASNAIINKKPIYIHNDNVIADAIYDEDCFSVEILPGSKFKKHETLYSIESYNSLLVKLLEDGIITDEEGFYVFLKDYTFVSKTATALSTSASFLFHSSKNGWEVWKTDNDISLSSYYKDSKYNDKTYQQDIIDKCWDNINKILVNENKYQVREDYHKAYFNFNFNKPYHGYIDFYEITNNIMNFGLCFNNKDNGLDKLYDLLVNEKPILKYEYKISKYERQGFINAFIEIPSLDESDLFYKQCEDIFSDLEKLIAFALEKI